MRKEISTSDLAKIRDEMENAQKLRQTRAAFSFVVRKHMDIIAGMSSQQKAKFLDEIGVKVSYMTELNKEISSWRYSKIRS